MPAKRKTKKVTFTRTAKPRISRRKRTSTGGVKSATRGVAGTVYTTYSKPKQSRKFVKRKVAKNISAIKSLGNCITYPNQYGNQCLSTANGVALLQVLGQAYDYSDLNTMLNLYTNNQGLSNDPPRKFVTSGYKANYTLKNNTNTDLEMDLYWVMARRDINRASVKQGTFGNGITYSDLTSVLVDGYEEQTNTVITPQTWPLSTTPFQITRFVEMFKILKSQRVLLGGGRNTIVKMDIPRNIHWQSDMIQGVEANVANNATYDQFGGRTTTLLAIIRGGVINDTTTKSMVSTAPVQFLLLGEESYSFYPSSGIVSQLAVPTSLATVTTSMRMTQETELVTAATAT